MFISFYLFSFLFIFFHVLLFLSLEKTITNLNHLHVDPRLSSADIRIQVKPGKSPPSWILLANPSSSKISSHLGDDFLVNSYS